MALWGLSWGESTNCDHERAWGFPKWNMIILSGFSLLLDFYIFLRGHFSSMSCSTKTRGSIYRGRWTDELSGCWDILIWRLMEGQTDPLYCLKSEIILLTEKLKKQTVFMKWSKEKSDFCSSTDSNKVTQTLKVVVCVILTGPTTRYVF